MNEHDTLITVILNDNLGRSHGVGCVGVRIASGEEDVRSYMYMCGALRHKAHFMIHHNLSMRSSYVSGPR